MSKEVGMSRKNRSKGGAPSRTQGARRASGESDGGGGALAPGQRWSATLRGSSSRASPKKSFRVLPSNERQKCPSRSFSCTEIWTST